MPSEVPMGCPEPSPLGSMGLHAVQLGAVKTESGFRRGQRRTNGTSHWTIQALLLDDQTGRLRPTSETLGVNPLTQRDG